MKEPCRASTVVSIVSIPHLSVDLSNLMASHESRDIRLSCPWGSVLGLEWGEPGNLHILAVHGWMDNCNTFHFLGPALAAAGYHVVAFDLPGHGHSDPMPAGLHCYDLEFVSVLHRLVRKMGWDQGKYSLLGHSLGGGICLVYTAAFPDQVELLVMLDITFLPVRPGTPLEFQPRLRASVLGGSNLEDRGKTKPAKLYKNREEAVQRMLQPALYMKERRVQQTITERSAWILLERGLREVDNGFIFTRDPRMSVPSLNNLSWEDQLQLAQKVSLECFVLIYLARLVP